MFQVTNSMGTCLLAGRWGSIKSARVYIMDALAMQTQYRLSQETTNDLKMYAARLKNKQWS